jgi:hypothetical protein
LATNWTEQLRNITQPPKTIDEAVTRLMSILDDEQKLVIATMSEDDLIDLHFSLGTAIRNAFGVHDPESKLLESCGAIHPDDVSGQIIYDLWKHLRTL